MLLRLLDRSLKGGSLLLGQLSLGREFSNAFEQARLTLLGKFSDLLIRKLVNILGKNLLGLVSFSWLALL